MYLSQTCNMFTETTPGENIGEIKDEPYVSDLGFGIGKLSVSPTPCVGSSANTVREKFSDAELLLPALDACSMIERPAARFDTAGDAIDADASVSIGLSDIFVFQHDEWKDRVAFESSDLDSMPSNELLDMQSEGQTKLLVEKDQTCDRNDSLVSCKAYERCATINMPDQNIESRKLSNNGRKASKISGFDLASLNILRRNRSSSSKPARSSIWGSEVQIKPDSEGRRDHDLNFGSQKTRSKVRGSKEKSNKKPTSRANNAPKSQTGRKSTGPERFISLKFKIGNKSCCIANANDNFIASGKEIPELLNTTNCKFGDNQSGDSIRDSKKVMLSDNCAPRDHVHFGSDFDIPSLKSSGKFRQTTISKDGYNFGTSSDNRFSDVGTSPDSEVINSVPDAPHSEKGKPGTQGSPTTSNACASPMVGSNLVLQKKTSKEGKKKNKLHQLGNSTVGKLTGEDITNSAEVVNSVGNFPGLSTLSKSRKGKKKSKPFQVGGSGVGSKPIGTDITDNVSPGAPDLGGFPTLGDVSESYETTRMASTNPHLSCMGTNFSSVFEAPIASATTQICGMLESSEHKSPKLSGAKGGSKVRSKISNLRSKNEKASKKKGNKNIIDDHHQSSDKVSSFAVHGGRDSLLESGKQTPFGVGESQDITKDLTGPVSTLHSSSYALMSQHTARKAWVLCDDCQKWRRIPAALADQVEDCGWTCKDNLDKEFADCSIPQEKSNSEINEELELSDGSGEEDTSDTFRKSNHNYSKVAEKSSWSLIKSNLFLHRRRKTQTIDEVMVCHCKPPSDGRMGCGAKCLNRMLNIECVRGTCPCGHLCSNQQFQKRKYSELKWFRCGKKGYGLQAVESISEGQFLIEYVGEVLDMHTHEARQREYAMKGHKHFYFMTLNGSEVIDACAKGNLGRFINHSCEPNCRTEKWMVNGEVCVGLFALRNIKKGEEVTFDYNYVRVFGAAAKKCVCGSPNCRGYIGGDPKNAEQIVQDDSDDEFKEPVMICEDREMNGDWNDIMSKCLKSGEQEAVKKMPAIKNRMKKHVGAAGTSTAESISIEKVEGVESIQVLATVEGEKLEIEGSIKKDFTVNVEQSDGNKLSGESFSGTVSETCKVESQGLEAHLHSSPQPMDCLPSEDIFRIFKSSAFEQPSTTATATPSESLSEPLESMRKCKLASSGVRDGPAKPNSLVKNKCSTLVPRKGIRQIKAGKEKITPELDKLNASSVKSQNMVEFSLNGHFEAVEEKLNELLDPEGGISKRKDASRGYLKLLFLTAASENSGHGEAIQSNRDLSMILDALLKTKSRTVLVDVINKNGLQMLHNILKRYRKEFTKTPILRKLLKVLEYLAIREILTLEHITGGPPRPGVESFKDSILTLTEHVDKQVHQIARSFRDRWIPKPLRRNCCVERDKGRIELHHRSVLGSSGYLSDRGGNPSEVSKPVEFQPVAAFVAVGTSTTLGVGVSPSLGSSSATNATVRKRKSRWDTPPEDYPHSRARTTLMIGDEKMSVDDDIPPGFSSSLNAPILPSNASSVVLNLQEKDTLIRQSPLSRITSYPPGDEKMGVDEDFPPGFSYRCNAPLVTNGPSAAINHHEVEIHTNQHHEDSRTRYSLAVDENMNSDNDIPPGFSSPSNALMGPSGPSSSSISHQGNNGHYQHSSPRSNYEGDERMKSDDHIPPGFASSSGHAVPSGPDASAINYQKSDVHAHKDMHPQTASKMAVDDDVPRFSSPFNDPIAFPGSPSVAVNSQKRKMDARQTPWNVVCGESQLKFVACKPLAYGISYSAVQQYGVLKAEGWSTARGVPFQPFPPLPPYGGPKGQRVSFASTPPSVEGVEKSDRSSTSSSYPSNENHRGTWSLENNPPVAHDRSEFQQGGSYNLGRKFLRQQKWNQPKVAPPWVRMRNGWGYGGASARNGVPGVVLGNEANGYRNSYS